MHDAAEDKSVRVQVRAFLANWLVDQNVEQALQFFAASAFQNEYLVQAPCVNYIPKGDFDAEAARRRGVREFLTDFLPKQKAANLSAVLRREDALEPFDQPGSDFTNDPRTDFFALSKVNRQQLSIEESSENEYLRSHLPESFYVSFIPVSEAMIYF